MHQLTEFIFSGLYISGVIKIFGSDFVHKNFLSTILSSLFFRRIFLSDTSADFGIITLPLIQFFSIKYPAFFISNKTKIALIIFSVRKFYEGITLHSDVFFLSFMFLNSNAENIEFFIKKIIESRENGCDHISFYRMDKKENCPICLEKEADISLPCGHYFRGECLGTAISKNSSGTVFPCPICRKNYNTFNLKTVFFYSGLQKK